MRVPVALGLPVGAGIGLLSGLTGVGGGAPNENYPREVMQLFSIGVPLLNLDGSVQIDGQGAPVPAYTQTDVQQLARALTGWTPLWRLSRADAVGNIAVIAAAVAVVATRSNIPDLVIGGVMAAFFFISGWRIALTGRLDAGRTQ